MLKQRILTIAIVLPLFIAALFLLPNLYWGVLMAAALLLAGREWARMAGLRPPGRAAFLALLAVSAIAILAIDHGGAPARAFLHTAGGQFVFALAAAFWLGIVPGWLLYRWRTRDPWLLGIVGWIVLVPFWYAVTWLQLEPARLLVALGVVWTADIAAYFAGHAFGRRRLAPEISPGKTWEGAAAALLAVPIYWRAVTWALPAFGDQFAAGLAWVALLAIVSIEGDLFESWMKRLADVKDSGSLLPGHGGLLDRVDALTSTLPFAALYFAYPLFGS